MFNSFPLHTVTIDSLLAAQACGSFLDVALYFLRLRKQIATRSSLIRSGCIGFPFNLHCPSTKIFHQYWHAYLFRLQISKNLHYVLHRVFITLPSQYQKAKVNDCGPSSVSFTVYFWFKVFTEREAAGVWGMNLFQEVTEWGRPLSPHSLSIRRWHPAWPWDWNLIASVCSKLTGFTTVSPCRYRHPYKEKSLFLHKRDILCPKLFYLILLTDALVKVYSVAID